MSTTNAPAYCEVEDVKEALQEADSNIDGTDGPLQTDYVEAAIFGASRWLRTTASAHWYDSNAAASDLISTSAATTAGRTLSVPSAAHPPRGQLRHTDKTGGPTRYPTTHAGPYCKVTLPVNQVESIDTLNVRDRGGDETDWVADSDFTEGRGDDYYLDTDGGARGRSYLYIHAGTLGSRVHYDDVLRVDLSYGRDWDSNPWDDVRRGVAALAAAQLITDDDVLTQLPDQGALIGLDTQAQRLVNIAMSEPGYLQPYMAAPVA